LPAKETEIAFSDAEEGKIDELVLEIHKSERDTKPPPSIKKVLVLFTIGFIIAGGIAVGVAALISNYSSDELRTFADWISILLLTFAGIALVFGSVTGVWGGQRNIPIRMVSPSDSTVVGKGLLITGYVIEDVMDNDVEITILNKDKEILYETTVAVDEKGIFYTEIQDELDELIKSTHIKVEAWIVTISSKQLKFAVREKIYKDLNVAKKGLKLGKIIFFPIIHRDFTDKVNAVFDPKRREKGVIENVKVSDGSTTNIFFPNRETDDKFIPFSFEKIAEMRQNAMWFDTKRKRRRLYRLVLLIITLLYLLPPLIIAFL